MHTIRAPIPQQRINSKLIILRIGFERLWHFWPHDMGVCVLFNLKLFPFTDLYKCKLAKLAKLYDVHYITCIIHWFIFLTMLRYYFCRFINLSINLKPLNSWMAFNLIYTASNFRSNCTKYNVKFLSMSFFVFLFDLFVRNYYFVHVIAIVDVIF